MNLTDDIRFLKGVGEQRALQFERLHIYNINDILTHFPRDYEDRRNTTKIRNVMLDEKNIIRAFVKTKPSVISFGKVKVVKFQIEDETGALDVVFFNQPYLKNVFYVNDEVLFVGKVHRKYGKIQLESPEYEKVNNNYIGEAIVPIYPLTYKLSQKVMRNTMKIALQMSKEKLIDKMPEFLKEENKLCNYKYAVSNIHYPDTYEAFFEARRRLVFEELFMLQLGLLAIKNEIKTDVKGIQFKKDGLTNDFVKKIPFSLTNAQNKVFNEIKDDMKSDKRMNRLVQGDVGSGKTILSVLSMILAVENGKQAVFMAPTEVLAKQHYEKVLKYFSDYNIATRLLVGSVPKKEKEEIKEKLKSGEIDVIIGTHAIIQDDVQFEKLGIVITDEQHRFGVGQRNMLSSKGAAPDILVMTATPIPRTLALILYGDLDISIIDEMPVGRKAIKTHVVNESYYERLYKFIDEEIEKGRQAYIVCPNVEESEINEDLKSVIEYSKELKKIFSTRNVEYLHGKMKPKEKNEIMAKYKAGEIDILISTTVIEVGVDVPNASIMVIENAERFGLSQLHQLRGRVGRGEYESHCVLITSCKTDICSERMKIMKDTTDGFIISEKDLELRGPGDFFGTKQHGIPELKIANLYKDVEILKEASEAAKKLMTIDPKLEIKENEVLKLAIGEMLEERINL